MASPGTNEKNDLIPEHGSGETDTGVLGKKDKTIRYLFKKPKSFLTSEQRQKQAHEHKHENWMELFMDLFYVAFFFKLGVIIHTCGENIHIMTYVASVFIGVYMCKFDFDQYMNKFTSEDLVHKIFFAVYSLGLAVMVLDVNESSKYGLDEEENQSDSTVARLLASSKEDLPLYCPEVYSYLSGFTSGWLVTRLSILTLYVIIAFYVKPQGQYLLLAKAPILLTSVFIMISNYFISSTEKYVHTYIIMAATLVEFFGWAGWEVLIYGSWLIETKGPTALIPTNIYHYAARTGTFVMLVLGEAVLALLTPTLLSKPAVYAFTLLGTLMIFILALLYFDAQPQGHATHALGISRFNGMIWISLHPLLSFLLFGVGVSLKLMYEDIVQNNFHPSNKLTLGIYLGLSLFVLAFIRATHKVTFSLNRLFTLSLRCFIAVLHIMIGVVSSHVDSAFFRNEASLVIHIVLILIPTLVDAWKYRHLDNLPTLDGNPQPVSRIPSGPRTNGRPTSAAFAQMAYSPSLRHMPEQLRPRRSSSVNDMYNNNQTPNPTTIAVQSLIENKPSAVVKQIVRRSSLPDNERQLPWPIIRNSSNKSITNEKRPVTRRKSSDSIEMSKQPTSSTPLRTNNSSIRSVYERSRVLLAPSLSVITDRSEPSIGDSEPDVETSNSHHHHHHRPHHHQHHQHHLPHHQQRDPELTRTRIFEYNENDELVEVMDDEDDPFHHNHINGNGNGNGNDDDDLYDEEYIDVVYEDNEDLGPHHGGDEIHVFEAPASMEVASHITWM